PSVAILRHRVSLSMNSMSCPNYVYRFILPAFRGQFLMKPMSNEVVTVEEKIRSAFMLPWRLQSTSGPDTKTHPEPLPHAGNTKQSPPQHNKKRPGDHINKHAKARHQKCKNRANKNHNRRRIRKSMRRHLEKFNGKNSYYSRPDAFHGCCGPPQLSDALVDGENWQSDDERRQEDRRGSERSSPQPRNLITHVRCNDYHR